MSSFHNDIFNRRAGGGGGGGGGGIFGDYSQTPFAPAHMPKPLFSENRRRSSFQSSSASLAQSKTFSYEAACEICEETVRCGRDLCVHEHRIVCRGVHHGCCCHTCCMSRESLTSTCHEDTSYRACREESSYSARTEESESDSKFGNGRVRSRSATTYQGDASFGFANMESEMLRMAADNRWRNSGSYNDSFYAKPLCNNPPPPPPNHMHLREDNVGQVWEHHRHMHGGMQSHMHEEAAAHFQGNQRHHHHDQYHGHLLRQQQEEEEDEIKVTTTTTTTTKKYIREIDDDKETCKKVRPPPPPPKPPVIVVAKPPAEHHHHHHHQTLIPIGVRPDEPVKKVEPCCTWCKILPCLDCPKPTNPNERFKKLNFRLFPEYEFLPDDLQIPKNTEYFPEHTHFGTNSQYKITIPQVTTIAQKVYVDFIGDQCVVMGDHGKPLRHPMPSPSVRSTRSSVSSRTQVKKLHHDHHSHHSHHSELPLGVTRVFAKNFFMPRDTYDHNRAQVFVKPNGKLKIVVPVLGS